MAQSKQKHQEFINEYFLRNMNATDAYQAVYPKATRESARRLGSQLLTNVDVKAEIETRLKEKQMSADEVLARLGDMAKADMGEFVRFQDGIKLPFLDLKAANDKGLLRLVKKFKYNAAGQPEIELYDAQAALLHIGKNHGLFTDKIEVKLEKEVDSILDTLEKELDDATFQRVLQVLSARNDNGETGAEATQGTSREETTE